MLSDNGQRRIYTIRILPNGEDVGLTVSTFTRPPSIPWTEGVIREASFVSASDAGILSMSFGKTGNGTSVIIGVRNSYMAAPTYECSIDNSGRLVLTEDGIKQAVFELLSFKDNLIELRLGILSKREYQRSVLKRS